MPYAFALCPGTLARYACQPQAREAGEESSFESHPDPGLSAAKR